MAIQSGDLRFFKSQNMTDADEGGGAPTSQEIVDGASNSIFPDISELDRAMGRVNIRKVFGTVVTEDTDTYLGANVLIAEPPDDPNVSVALVKVDDFFSTRKDIQTRLESFLAVGAVYAGFVFGNMLQGQQVVTLVQRTNVSTPEIGATLVLRKRSGQLDETTQFIRVTGVGVQLRTFEDNNGIYERNIVTLNISESLLADFPGFDASRADPGVTELSARTSVFESVVADAARYYGTVPLEDDASIGDFTLKASGVYTRIVPSAQVETPIADARSNGIADAWTSTGTPIVQTFNSTFFLPGTNVFIGGAITPGSLTITGVGTSSVTLTDEGGRLLLGGDAVGVVDYENGICSLSVNVFGTNAVTMTITYTPMASASVTSRSIGIPVTIASRSLSYVVTLTGIPARRSLMISYAAQGRWYVLRDDGSGRITGGDPAYGVGSLNRTTGTVTMTLGALPDTGSAVLLQWADDARMQKTSNTELALNGFYYFAVNSAGQNVDQGGTGALTPGSITLNWLSGGSPRVATDNGNGIITAAGDHAFGTVDYQAGLIRFATQNMPPPGTVLTITQTRATSVTATIAWTGTGPFAGSLPANVTPRTVFLAVSAELMVTATTSLPRYYSDPRILNVGGNVVDDGAGLLKLRGVTVGTINYTTGAMTLDFSDADFDDPALTPKAEANWLWLADAYQVTGGVTVATTVLVPILDSMRPSDRVLTRTTQNIVPSGGVTYSVTSAVSSPISTTLEKVYARVEYVAPNHTLTGVSFNVSYGYPIRGTNTGLLVRQTNFNSSTLTPVGEFNPATGELNMSVWEVGYGAQMNNWTGIQAPPLTGESGVGANVSVMFRVASAPVRPGSFSLVATMEDGTSINTTAATNGRINHSRVKGRINYENGVVELYFCNPSTTALGTYDITYMEIPGITTINLDTVDAETIRYNAVAYSYIPLDASIIGLNPVRLPSDGRVPIIRAGSVVVVGNTGTLPPATVTNGQVLDSGRERLSRVRLRGNNGVLINSGYTADLDTGLVTIDNVTGWSQPVTLEHRIEDMALVSDAQINGEIRLTRPLTHDYPAAGTFVSSALVLGDIYAHMTTMFDQQSWNGVTWPTSLTGNAAPGTYNIAAFPLQLTNEGAVTESWALQFTSSTGGNIIGKHIGVIGTFNINSVTAPLNPANLAPYWRLLEGGWGVGWSSGNVVFFDTIGATYPVCIVRVVQQGPESGINYAFSLLSRGDVDRP